MRATGKNERIAQILKTDVTREQLAKVVRCKDCAHCEVHLDGSHVCGLTHLAHMSDHYCADGVREVH